MKYDPDKLYVAVAYDADGTIAASTAPFRGDSMDDMDTTFSEIEDVAVARLALENDCTPVGAKEIAIFELDDPIMILEQ